MKILQTPVRFYPFVGGVENYVYNLSKELVELGHEVTVVCANEPKVKSKEIIEGIKVKRLNYIGKVANTNTTLKLPLELFKEDFDILHTHLPTPWSADWSAIISKIKRKLLVLTYHNDLVGDGFANYIAKFYNLTSLNLVLKRAAKIMITQPNYLESSPYIKNYENKIEVIPNGVDITKFRPIKVEKEENTLFFLSVLDEYHRYKGLDYLLKGLMRVKKEIPNVRLIVGGEGKLLNYYKQKASSMGLRDNVEFAGFIPDEQIVKYYNKCDLFILPSISAKQEGFGIVLLEAMACEKPVVSTEIVGVAEDVREGNAGRIVKPNDEEALVEAIIKILTDKDLAMKMGINGRKLVEEKYTWEMIAAKVLNLYEGLL
ncbi:MAG: glycosyltransferase family 4 protein [Methanophagales archaeon]|nr:glycosyltransferase family 4 protein [Methanophagales archaeon]